MNLNDVFTSNYLKASDLNGSAVPVTIEKVEIEQVGRNKDEKLVVHFKGKDKGFVLNKTNAKKIAEIAGSSETDDWRGIAIVLYGTEVDFQGDTVEAIRVKAPKAAVAKPKPAPVDADEDPIPF